MLMHHWRCRFFNINCWHFNHISMVLLKAFMSSLIMHIANTEIGQTQSASASAYTTCLPPRTQLCKAKSECINCCFYDSGSLVMLICIYFTRVFNNLDCFLYFSRPVMIQSSKKFWLSKINHMLGWQYMLCHCWWFHNSILSVQMSSL